MSGPVRLRWLGDSFEPVSPFWQQRADAEYVVGEVYDLTQVEERSMASHRFYFATLNEGFRNLPETVAAQFMNVEALRKRLLIQTGYCDRASIACASKAEAQRVAGFIKPIDPYGVVLVNGATVIHLTAQSQSVRAMTKARFEASKRDTLGLLAHILEVGPEALEQAAAEGEQD